jgi:chromosome segregation ATPase
MSENAPDREPSPRPAPPAGQGPPSPQGAPVPPVPPPQELLRPAVPHVPLTPMMDFFQRRLEALEAELNAERQRAQAAQNLLGQQDAMRSEVESSLKSLHEQLRREKAEKETEAEKSHSRGRIDALEKRLDEMHQTWAALLKDAVAARDSQDRQAVAAQAAVGREVGAVADGLRDLKAQVEAWRSDVSIVPQAGAALGQLARELPERERRLLTEMQDRLAAFAAELADRLSAWEQRHVQEGERQEARLSELGRERAALQRQWDEANHAVRQEFLQERIAREETLAGNIAEVCRRLDAVAAGESKAEAAASELKEQVGKIFSLLNASPKAKDELAAELEREKADLIKSLRDRSDLLARYMSERREVEKTMGAGLLELNSKLDAERDRGRELQGRIAELELQAKADADRADRAAADRDRIAAVLSAERDALARALVAETEKVRLQLDGRVQAESDWLARLQELQKRLEAELARGGELNATIAELRAQVATLTEHMTKALQDKDAIVNRFGSWSQERENLLRTIREKDEMISMLSSTFQGMLKKE